MGMVVSCALARMLSPFCDVDEGPLCSRLREYVSNNPTEGELFFCCGLQDRRALCLCDTYSAADTGVTLLVHGEHRM